jgi:2-C-methyl-D-erythritol 4-phosphate cytidylyltransferase
METSKDVQINPPHTAAIIVAAGSSRRMQGINKLSAPLGTSTVLAHTISVFAASPHISQIILIVASDALEEAAQFCRAHDWPSIRVIPGGARRRDSARAGLENLAADPPDYILIHDGARPFVTADLIARSLAAAQQHGAASAALPVKDTIKRAGPDGLVIETLDRAALWAVQTPQAFAYHLILRAHRSIDPAWDATDDAVLIEALGQPVALITGLHENLKITTPADLLLAQAILQARLAAREENP